MSLRLDKVHNYVLEPGGMTVKLVSTNPYIRFSTEQGTIFLQAGRFFYEGGEEVDKLPTWLDRELEKANPKALKECGYSVDENQEADALSGVPNTDTPKRRAPAGSSKTEETTTPKRRVVRRVSHGSSNR